MSADWLLQVAIRNALANYAPLVAALADGANSIRDHAKQGTPYPYIVIGEADLSNDDTKDSHAWTASVTIHCWSTYAGRKEVKQVLGHVYDALHQKPPAMTGGYRCADCLFTLTESFVEPDGKTRHGVIEFDFWIEQE